MDSQLLTEILALYMFQPATALWRAVEIDMLLSHPFPEGRGLDLGCGDGKLTELIARRIGPHTWIGIDVDPLETKQAASRGLYEQVFTSPGSEIPAESDSFDFVLSNSVLEHIPEVEPVIAETARVLKPGGLAIFTVPGIGFHSCLRGPLIPGNDRTAYLKMLDDRLAHYYYFSIAEWEALLNRHGITLETGEPYLNKSEVQRWETLSRFTGGLLYAVYGRRKKPIAIQRDLGLRTVQAERRMPTWCARLMSRAVTIGMGAQKDTLKSESYYGCVLLRGRKR